jgi:hypothetical protein
MPGSRRQKAYEPFVVERSVAGAVDAVLRRRLPDAAYLRMLRKYNRLRRLARCNPGRGHVLPDFVILGAAKAGTTSLYAWLCQHPFVARSRLKELHYFTFNYYRGEDWYRSNFPTEAEKAAFARERGRPFITGEGSPSYLWKGPAVERMAALLPSAKLIVALRDPVDRAYSQFQMRRNDGFEPVESFFTAVALEDPRIDGGEARARWRENGRVGEVILERSYLERSRYAEQLERWMARYPREQLHIVTTDELAADPQAAFARLQEFLELPAHEPAGLEARFTSSYALLAAEERARIADYFRADNERLYALLGTDLGWR